MRLSELRLPVLALTGLVGFCLSVQAQQLISARSGLIHYTEGEVKIADQPAGQENGVFKSLANGKELITTEGRAEMLLGPGQFVRLNENTSVRMVSNKLEATRVDVLRGSVLVEIVDIDKSAPITVGFGVNTIELRKPGLYRVDADESRIRVYEGEAIVQGNGQTVTARKGKEVSMGAVLAQNGFDATPGDEFSRWAQRRAGYIATANISGARDLYSSGQNWSANDWAFNPWYGMYTYIPSRRMFASPFGFHSFTPEMAFNGMFWPYLGGGYGFYGMGFGYGYGYGYPYYGSGYGYGYGSGYSNGYGSNYAGGGKGVSPNRNGYPTPNRPDAFGPRGTNVSGYNSNNGYGSYGGPSMVRGGGTPTHNGDSNAGSYRGGGGYSSVNGGGGHSSGSPSYSGGGGHSSGGTVSSGGSSGATTAPAGGGASSAGSSAGGRSK